MLHACNYPDHDKNYSRCIQTFYHNEYSIRLARVHNLGNIYQYITLGNIYHYVT